MKRIIIKVAFLSAVLFIQNAAAQTSFDLQAYQQFLQTYKNMSTAQLLEMHPAGIFEKYADISWNSALYHDSIEIKYKLTDDEIALLNKHGFMVTERLPVLNESRFTNDTFLDYFLDIWYKDLPVFISSDAILHAFHYNYDKILIKIERGYLIPRITQLLREMHRTLPDLAATYNANPELDRMLRDVDIYLTVPLRLLGEDIAPNFAENTAEIDEILTLIDAEQFDLYPFFSEHCKEIDFSQFTPRGHYTDDDVLSGYFRAMMWLGRIEMYLIAPESDVLFCPKQTLADIQRQIIDTFLITELMDRAEVKPLYDQIEEVITFLVGEQDNVTPPNTQTLFDALALNEATQFLDTLVVRQFQDTLATKSWAFQRILSQILAHDPLSDEPLKPAVAFMLFGQRYVIDSYVTGNVVADKIIYQDEFICRLFPSTLDILFALGNDASAQLLQPELDEYFYATNLSALRYLVDSYDTDFWQSSIYNMWLGSIRSLNPPAERKTLPQFMQTAAWWQQKMNTQLASWTELRHDNLLYAKQSYTGSYGCFYPYGFVEPIPEFFDNMRTLGRVAAQKFAEIPFSDEMLQTDIIDYFNLLEGISDTLGIMAQKELDGVPFDRTETAFIGRLLYQGPYGVLNGWYMYLLKGPPFYGDAFDTRNLVDYLVADYHTTPTDCFGNVMGWVSHAGTGPIDMAIITAPLSDGRNVAYVGPVMSYREYRTTNFLRLTDEKWAAEIMASASRPEWVNIYLADNNGKSRGSGLTLVTSIDQKPGDKGHLPETHLVAGNYPNPFNATTIIYFTIPSSLSHNMTELTVYNIQGKVVKRLLDENLPAGNYLTQWDGNDDNGRNVASGIYFYQLRVGAQQISGKMVMVK